MQDDSEVTFPLEKLREWFDYDRDTYVLWECLRKLTPGEYKFPDGHKRLLRSNGDLLLWDND